ncbi:hypothetical protein [Actinocrispum sp. NPDC049592]|uniref:hypothetical protein n=1 Tax=Actinocrispum sp. NPDC049592 TaxID=3154835 RepID=UPI00342A01AD
MRIRSTVVGLAVAAGVLLVGGPAALAQQQPTTSPAAPTPATSRAPAATAAPSVTTSPGAPTRTTTRPATPQVVKPRGAAETGGGGTSDDSLALFAIGGAALVLTGGAGTVAYRRLRRQS